MEESPPSGPPSEEIKAEKVIEILPHFETKTKSKQYFFGNKKFGGIENVGCTKTHCILETRSVPFFLHWREWFRFFCSHFVPFSLFSFFRVHFCIRKHVLAISQLLRLLTNSRIQKFDTGTCSASLFPQQLHGHFWSISTPLTAAGEGRVLNF